MIILIQSFVRISNFRLKYHNCLFNIVITQKKVDDMKSISEENTYDSITIFSL